MIQKTISYQVGDELFPSLEKAQEHELNLIAGDGLHPDVGTNGILEAIAANLVRQRDKVIDILSTTPKSRVRARKSNGATRKPRNSKPAAPTSPETNTTHL